MSLELTARGAIGRAVSAATGARFRLSRSSNGGPVPFRRARRSPPPDPGSGSRADPGPFPGHSARASPQRRLDGTSAPAVSGESPAALAEVLRYGVPRSRGPASAFAGTGGARHGRWFGRSERRASWRRGRGRRRLGGGFFTFLSTEDDPLATTLETNLPAGPVPDHAVRRLVPRARSGWRGDGGRCTAGQSPQTLDFFISANEETFVSYRFETNGDIIDFGNGG